MLKYFIYIIFLFTSFNALTQESDLQVVTFDELQPLMRNSNDTTYVINFWATWCKPCVEELPYFEIIHEELNSKNVKVVLVSLDDIDNLDSKVKPFVNEMYLQSKLFLLNDINYNSWIDKVDPSWSGAIPATLIYNKNFRGFFEQSFELEELKKIINENRIKS
jgi:thiol-disulfide isomerase/thioredoxin